MKIYLRKAKTLAQNEGGGAGKDEKQRVDRFLWSEKVVVEVFQVPEQRFPCMEQMEPVESTLPRTES